MLIIKSKKKNPLNTSIHVIGNEKSSLNRDSQIKALITEA